MPRRNRKVSSKGLARINAARRYTADLRPGEKLVPNYAVDCAPCSCCATHKFSTVPCISVAQTDDYHRCLLCSTMWTRRAYRWQPTRVIEQPRAARRAA